MCIPLNLLSDAVVLVMWALFELHRYIPFSLLSDAVVLVIWAWYE